MTIDDVADLVASWQGAEGERPMLTWYGPGGDRVELSGPVLANWVIKVANLLTEEADAEPGTVVGVDLPPHWRALVWSLGAWLTGARVHLGDRAPGAPEDAAGASGGTEQVPASAAEVLVTDRPSAAPSVPVLIAVALPALAMSYDGELPPGAIDGAADLMTFPDQLILPTRPAELAPISAPPWTGPGRVLLAVTASVAALVPQVLSIWRAGASVVLVADPAADVNHLARVEGAEPATLTIEEEP